MKIVLYSLFLFSTFSACSQPKSKTTNSSGNVQASTEALCYQTYGLPNPHAIKALREVLGKYAVSIKAVAGCVVTDSLLKSVERNNEHVFAALDKRLGAGSQTRIMAEVDGFAKTQERIEEILRKEKSVQYQEAKRAQSNTYESLSFNWKPMTSMHRFAVNADRLQYISGKWETSHWSQFTVDTLLGTAQQQ
jgi:hypothetical protein